MITESNRTQTIASQIASAAFLISEVGFGLDLINRSNSRIAEAQAAHRSAGKSAFGTRKLAYPILVKQEI